MYQSLALKGSEFTKVGNKGSPIRDFLHLLEQDRMQMAALIAQEFLPRLRAPLGLIRAKAESLSAKLENGTKEEAEAIKDQVDQLESLLATLNGFLTVEDIEENFNFYEELENLKVFFQTRLGRGRIQVLNMIPSFEKKMHLRKIKPLVMSLFLYSLEALEFSSQEPRCLFIQHRKTASHDVFCFEVNGMASPESINLAVCKSLAKAAGCELKLLSRPSRIEIHIPFSSSDAVANPYSRSLR